MKTTIILLAVAFLSAGGAQAQYKNPFETTDQARQRISSERYQQQQRRTGTPLGGYRDTLGSPAPRGTERPGYVTPQPYGYGNTPSNSDIYGSSRRKRY